MSKTKKLIDELIERRSNGVEFLKISTRMKLLMKGIDTNKINDTTPDDASLIAKIYLVAEELNVKLEKK